MCYQKFKQNFRIIKLLVNDEKNVLIKILK